MIFRMKYLLLLFLFSEQVQAQIRNQGELAVYFQSLTATNNGKNTPQFGGIDFSPQLDAKLPIDWRFKFDSHFDADFLAKENQDQFQSNFKNIFIEKTNKNLKVRLGYQIVTPSGPDILNPADLIHAKNWKNPTAPKTLGSAGVAISQEIDAWSWEIFYIPKQQAARLPGEKSIWWPREKRLPIESEFISEARIPADLDYRIADPVETDSALSNNFALKLQGISEAFEGNILLYEGLSQEPKLFFAGTSTNFVLDSPVTLIPFYFRHRAYAMNFVLPFSTWSIKGGANWMKPMGSDFRTPGEESTAVLGAEKNLETKWGLVSLLIQHERQQRQARDQISFLRSLFENAWTIGARIPMGENHVFSVGGSFDTIGKSSVLKSNYRYRITDNLSTELDAQLLQGPEDTLIGLYSKYDQYSFRMNINW